MSNKTECFSYEGGEAIKEVLARVMNKYFQFVIVPKNKAILSFKIVLHSLLCHSQIHD